jgi:LacI family transcriptional regulator
MKKIVRVIDIANALGLSRNTVGKVLNGHKVPEKTRNLVLQKAVEMGYKNMGIVAQNPSLLENQRILLFTTHSLLHIDFFASLIKGIESVVHTYKFELIQYTFSGTQTNKEISNYLKLLKINGIICIELFDEKLINHLLSLDIPTVFIDFIKSPDNIKGNYDVVMMESINSVASVCTKLIREGQKEKLAFVGDFNHCLGFYERFRGMREALYTAKLPYNHNLSITEPDSFPYGNPAELTRILRDKEKADVYVCANDAIAISLLKSLARLNIKVPQDVSVIGFDNIVDAELSIPSLTTLSVDKEYLGVTAIKLLIDRINNPHEITKSVYIKSDIIFRKSTAF